MKQTYSIRAGVSFPAMALLLLGGCGGDEPEAVSAGAISESVTTESGLMYTVTQAGSGTAAAAGNNVSVHYTGWLYDPQSESGRGNKFDSSVDRGTPFQFPLGGGRVIAGWDEGVAGMLIGEVRELIIPPDLGYGARGFPPVIPPDSTLVFEVELLAVE